MMQVLYTFIGVLFAFGVVFLILYLVDLNDNYKHLKEKLDEHEENHKIPYRNNSYQYAPYRQSYYGQDSDLRYRVNQLNSRVNDILDDIDDMKLKWDQKFGSFEEVDEDEDESEEEES